MKAWALIAMLSGLSGTALAQDADTGLEETLEHDAASNMGAPTESAAPLDSLRTRRSRLIDTSADVLAPGEQQLGVFWLEYSRGILPGLQLSAHGAGYLASVINLNAKYQLVNRPELQVSAMAGGAWLAAARVLNATFLSIPVDLRATAPLGRDIELTVASGLRWMVLDTESAARQSRTFFAEANVVRYDSKGSWILRAQVPLIAQQRLSLGNLLGQPVVGDLFLDDVSAWSVGIARDHLVKKTAHIRFGLGYRNKPGMIFVDSLGPLLVEFGVYWRWG